eukprot:3090448-Pyramimonas_sp.AAC.1
MEGGSLSKHGSRHSKAHIRLNKLPEFHGLRAGGFQQVAPTSARRTFVGLHGLRTSRFQNVALASARRTFVNICKNFTD